MVPVLKSADDVILSTKDPYVLARMSAMAKSEAAFTQAAMVAATTIRSLIERSQTSEIESVVKMIEGDEVGEVTSVAAIAKVLTDVVAKNALAPLHDVEFFERAAFEERALIERARRIGWEADQIAKREWAEKNAWKEHSDDCSCDTCQYCDERHTHQKAAAKVDDSRPPEWERTDETRQSVPWREEDEQPEVEQPPAATGHVEHGVSKRILDEAGFDDDGGGVFKSTRDGHIFKWVDGGFLITDGWSGETTYKGETIADFRAALALLDE